MRNILKGVIVTTFISIFASNSFAENVEASDIKKENPSFTLDPIGTVKLDYLYMQDVKNRFYFRDISGGIKGKIFYDFKYKLKFNLAPRVHDRVTQAYLEYKALDPFSIKVGRFSPAFFLDYDNSFNEYPASASMLEQLKDGVQVRTYGDRWTLATSYGNSGAIVKTQPNNRRHALYVSGTYLPYYDEANKEYFHVGLSNSYMKPTNHILQYKIKPEASSKVNLLDTGTLSAVNYGNVTNISMAYNKGPFSTQLEYLVNKLNRDANNKDLLYHGGYIQAAYFLTGESQGYDHTTGEIKGVNVNNPVFEFGKKNQKLGTGAWEVAAKYSTLNLNDNSKGKLNLYGVAFNWYLNNIMKFSNDFLIARTDKNAALSNKTSKIASIRLQIDL